MSGYINTLFLRFLGGAGALDEQGTSLIAHDDRPTLKGEVKPFFWHCSMREVGVPGRPGTCPVTVTISDPPFPASPVLEKTAMHIKILFSGIFDFGTQL